MHTITDARALADPAFDLPKVPDVPRGIGWLRANVARFSSGDEHHRRRALATALLDTVDPAELRRRAFERAGTPDREVIVGVLAEALGMAVPAAAVFTVARAYQPHLESGPDIDAAVATLVEACGGVWDEATAARIGLLVQACDATAALVANALRHNGSIEDALREEPPVRSTRRVRDGETVAVDLSGSPFGAGPHACPGRAHAIAVAAGILDRSR